MDINKNLLIPCVWLNAQGADAAHFYSETFSETTIQAANPLSHLLYIHDTQFLIISGDLTFKPNACTSYLIYEHDSAILKKSYDNLCINGKVNMPLGVYPWSDCYAWVEDKYGVHWQLNIDKSYTYQKVVPSFLFNQKNAGKIGEAVDFYQSVFPNFQVTEMTKYPSSSFYEPERILLAKVIMHDTRLHLLDSDLPLDIANNAGNSLVLHCQNQQELDHYWQALGAQGTYSKCGWLQDKFGFWWQVLPHNFNQAMAEGIMNADFLNRLKTLSKINFSDMVA